MLLQDKLSYHQPLWMKLLWDDQLELTCPIYPSWTGFLFEALPVRVLYRSDCHNPRIRLS